MSKYAIERCLECHEVIERGECWCTTPARCPEHDLDLPCGACAAEREAGR